MSENWWLCRPWCWYSLPVINRLDALKPQHNLKWKVWFESPQCFPQKRDNFRVSLKTIKCEIEQRQNGPKLLLVQNTAQNFNLKQNCSKHFQAILPWTIKQANTQLTAWNASSISTFNSQSQLKCFRLFPTRSCLIYLCPSHGVLRLTWRKMLLGKLSLGSFRNFYEAQVDKTHPKCSEKNSSYKSHFHLACICNKWIAVLRFLVWVNSREGEKVASREKLKTYVEGSCSFS